MTLRHRAIVGIVLLASVALMFGCQGSVGWGQGVGASPGVMLDGDAARQYLAENLPTIGGGLAGGVVTATTGSPQLGAMANDAATWGITELLAAIGIGGGVGGLAAAGKSAKEGQKERGKGEAAKARAEGELAGFRAAQQAQPQVIPVYQPAPPVTPSRAAT